MDKTSNKHHWTTRDREIVWHPYSAIGADLPVFPVESAHGVRLRLADGRELIDGMSSWISRMDNARPLMRTTMVGVPVSATARMSSSCLPVRSRLATS